MNNFMRIRAEQSETDCRRQPEGRVFESNSKCGIRNVNTEPSGVAWAACLKDSPKGEPRGSVRGNCGVRNEKHEMTAGSANPPYLQPVVGAPRRGALRLLNVAWASRPYAKLLSILIYCGAAVGTMAQDESISPPTASVEALPPESYTFAMKLPLGTDCSVTVKPKGSEPKSKGGDKKGGTSDSGPTAMKIERIFRKGLSLSKEIRPDGTETDFYSINGMCAYDSPKKGLNVRRDLPGHEISNLNTYAFPELQWAVPETQDTGAQIKPGNPPVKIYGISEEHRSLEVDPSTGLPQRYTEGQMEWTYSYKQATAPIVMPENLRKAFPDHE